MTKPKKILFYLLVLCLPIIILFFQFPIFSSLKLWVVDSLSLPNKIIQTPFQEAKKLIFYRSIYRQNIKLRNEVNSLKKMLIDFEELKQENMRLKKLLSFKNESELSLITAKVISRDLANWSSSLVIDKGSAHGVKPNMVVITSLGLVGKVQEVGVSTSKVILINDPKIAIASLVIRSREQGIISGTVGGLCRMRYLSKNSDVRVNDQVIASGLNDSYPKGILIGEVIELEDELEGVSRNCLIRPAVDLYKLEEVLLVK